MFTFSFISRAEAEAHLLINIQHKHIVKAFGIIHCENKFGIVMEEISGGTLEDLLLEEEIDHISWQIRLRIIKQINEALIYLHSGDCHNRKPCVHGDLKPQNILLTLFGVVKVADFGTAVLAQTMNISSSSMSFDAGNQYTPNYTAPEFFRGEKSCATDMYR